MALTSATTCSTCSRFGRGDRRVVREIRAHAVVAAQVAEHLHEPGPERVQLGLVPRPRDAGTTPHERVEVGCEREPTEARSTPLVQSKRKQIVGAEVAMAHRHRLTTVLVHRRQRGRLGRGGTPRRRSAGHAHADRASSREGSSGHRPAPRYGRGRHGPCWRPWSDSRVSRSGRTSGARAVWSAPASATGTATSSGTILSS